MKRQAWMHAPVAALHLSCLAVVFVGWSPAAVAVAAALFVSRGFGITGFYHRGFAHRAFRMSRPVQFAGAALGASAAQRGPLWWVAHHRTHHLYADRPGDPHSPRHHGIVRSHVLWAFDPANNRPDLERVSDLAAFPELRFVDRVMYLFPALVAVGTFGLGVLLARVAPASHTSGLQMLVWGFCISTVAIYHVTWSVNSLGHRIGRRRYETRDDSRNVWWLSVPTLGESWHNNHHRFPGSARQGWAPWELDVTWLLLRVLHKVGLVSDLRPVPDPVVRDVRRRTARAEGGVRLGLEVHPAGGTRRVRVDGAGRREQLLADEALRS